MIYLQVQTDVAPAHWSRFFLIPALIDYSANYPGALKPDERTNSPELEEAALEAFIRARDGAARQDNPVARYAECIESYKTRGELAHLNPQYYTKLLDDAFNKQNEDIANAFYDADKFLIASVLSQLPEDELGFINTANISLPTFALVKRHQTRPLVALPALPYDPDRVTIIPHPAYVNLVGAERGEEKRCYALAKKQAHYTLTRVDSDIVRYRMLLPKEDRLRVQDDFTLELTYRPGPQPGAGETAHEALFKTLALDHKNTLRQALFDFGYALVPVEWSMELLLSMLPLYSCLSTKENREKGEQLYYCGMDALAFAPPF